MSAPLAIPPGFSWPRERGAIVLASRACWERRKHFVRNQTAHRSGEWPDGGSDRQARGLRARRRLPG